MSQISDDVHHLIGAMDKEDTPSKASKAAVERLVVGVLTDLHRLADAAELIARHVRAKKPLLDDQQGG
jgi:hypothetical protein